MLNFFKAVVKVFWALLVSIAAIIPPYSSALASPYDPFTTRPGDIIRNQAVIEWQTRDGFSNTIITSNEVTVGTFTTPIELILKHHDPVSGTMTVVAPSLYSSNSDSGPFHPMPAPRDNAGQPLSISSPLPLSDVDRIRGGETLFVFVENEGMNVSSATIDSLILTLTDSTTNDREYLTLFETGPDTGVFSGHVFTQRQNGAAGGNAVPSNLITAIIPDGTLITNPRAIIEATYRDPFNSTRTLSREVLVGPVDPFGLFFDSRTGAPVDGVRVTIVDDTTGQPARVWGEDLIADYPSTIVSGGTVTDSAGRVYTMAPGEYRFPFVNLGRYRLIIEAPEGFVAPSIVSDATLQGLAGAPFALVPGSRLESFDVVEGPPIRIDIPMDGAGFLTISRAGSAETLEVGDFIEYTVTVKTTDPSVSRLTLDEFLPRGISIIADTLRIDGQPFAGLDISPDGRKITLRDLAFSSRKDLVLSYVARVSPDAREGALLTSRSEGRTGRTQRSEASHDLSILATFGRDHDILLGKIEVGSCGQEDNHSVDLTGIRIILGDGRQATTGRDGRFVFRSISQGGHVVGIDPLSLPAGYTPVLCEQNTASAGSATTRFVEARGGLARQVSFRIEKGEAVDHPEPVVAPYRASATYDADWFAANPSARGFIYPADGHLPRSKSATVVGVRPAGGTITLTMNGTAVPDLHRAPVIRGNGADMMIWKGVALREGVNTIEMTIADASGTVVSRETRTIHYNNSIHRMSVVADQSILTSNGRTRPLVTLEITNADGQRLHPGAMASVEIADPFLFSETTLDEDGVEIRRQVSTIKGTVDADGLMRLRLAPPRKPGHAQLRILTDDDAVTTKAYIAGEDMPFLIVGLAGGTAAHKSVAQNMRPLNESSVGQIGDIALSGRTTLFAQGVVKGKWFLTARYDSSLRDEKGDFFALDPEADYIVFADQSAEGNEASSRHPLYLKLENDTTEFLYGDFDTGITQGVATYTRRLTGARALFGNDMFSVTAFAARTDQSFAEDIFPADGTTGPFDLVQADILTFSETVTLETRSRIDPERVLDRQELMRGRDYDINYRTGRIFLSRPVLSRDADLNPNFITVRYEVDGNGDKGMILGGRVEMRPSEQVSIAATAVQEDNISGSTGQGRMVGLDGTWSFSENLSLTFGLGYSEQDVSDTLLTGASGHSARLGLTWAMNDTEIEAWIQHQSTGFGIANQSDIDDDLLTAGMTARFALGETTDPATGEPLEIQRHLETTILAEKNLSQGDEKLSADVMRIRRDATTERGLGLRAEYLDMSGETGTALKAIGRTAFESEDGKLRLSVGQEMTLLSDGNAPFADYGLIEAEYDLTEKLTMRLTNEVVIDKDIHVSIFGLSADYQLFENTMMTGGAFSAEGGKGSNTVGHIGLEHSIPIDAQTQIKVTVDRQAPLSGDFDNLSPLRDAGLSNPRIDTAYTSAALSIDHKGDIWTSSYLLEGRSSDTEDQARLSIGSARDLGDDIAIGTRVDVFAEELAGGEQTWEAEAQASAAWRPREANFIVLDKLRLRHEDKGRGQIRQTRIINSLYYTSTSEAGHQTNLRHGIKYAQFDFSSGKQSDILNLIGAEYRYKMNGWSDLGAHGALLHSHDAGSTSYSYGLSLGLTPFQNGWLAIGYNWAGFAEEDFSQDGFTEKGAFVQFRIKFDQDSLKGIVN